MSRLHCLKNSLTVDCLQQLKAIAAEGLLSSTPIHARTAYKERLPKRMPWVFQIGLPNSSSSFSSGDGAPSMCRQRVHLSSRLSCAKPPAQWCVVRTIRGRTYTVQINGLLYT